MWAKMTATPLCHPIQHVPAPSSLFTSDPSARRQICSRSHIGTSVIAADKSTTPSLSWALIEEGPREGFSETVSGILLRRNSLERRCRRAQLGARYGHEHQYISFSENRSHPGPAGVPQNCQYTKESPYIQCQIPRIAASTT